MRWPLKTSSAPRVGYPEGVYLMMEVMGPLVEKHRPGLNFAQIFILAAQDPRIRTIDPKVKDLVFLMTEFVLTRPTDMIMGIAIVEDVQRKVPDATPQQVLALSMAHKNASKITPEELRAPLFAFAMKWPKD